MVGHFVGYAANAAIGVSWQIFLVVIVFIASLFTGMGVLVARFAGANDPARVDRTVYQAFLVAVILAVGIMAPVGLLRIARAPAARQRHAGGQRARAAVSSDDVPVQHRHAAVLHARGGAACGGRRPYAASPWRLLTVLNLGLNVVLIRGWGPIPALGTFGSALGTVIASSIVSAAAIVDDSVGSHGDPLPPPHVMGARLDDHSPVVQVRPASRTAGRGDERRPA